VYFLVGPDPDFNSRDSIYIGEGDNVFSRIVTHDKDESKDFWTRACVVTSKDANLTKSHVRYLESRLIELAHVAGRAKVSNGTMPPPPALPEPDVADAEYFLKQIQLILPVLSLGFLQPKPNISARHGASQPTISQADTADTPEAPHTPKGQSPEFIIEQLGVQAFAREVNGEFVVMEGSTARREGTRSWTGYRKQRDELVDNGLLVKDRDPALHRFVQDVAFPSPSAAANAVLARQSNGRTEWKVRETGETYADWHEAKLNHAGAILTTEGM
jgi:hypothetical protein